MKKFVIRIFIFLMIVCVIASIVDYMITKGLRQVYSIEFAVWNDIYNGIDMNNDLVVLGASTAWTSYNTYMMDSALHMSTYNLGIDGHHWSMYKVRYEAYREVANMPQYIVINFDKSTFCEKLEEPYMREQFLPYPKLMWQIWLEKEYTIADICLPYCRYIGYSDLQKTGMKKFLNMEVDPWFEQKSFHKGYFGQERNWEALDFNDTTTLAFRPAIACSNVVKEDMIKFIEARQKEGATIILCKYPIYLPYYEQCRNVDKFDAVCEEICERTNVTLFDFSQISIAGDTTYFYNPTHLNVRGAEVFTRDFCERFKERINE